VLEPVVTRYQGRNIPRYFRADAAFANPELYEYLEAEGFEYAHPSAANDALQRDIEPLLDPTGGASLERAAGLVCGFLYQAKSWDRARRVVAKVEWHNGELFPRVGFYRDQPETARKRWCGSTTSVARRSRDQGRQERRQMDRLSCHDFADNQVRLQLSRVGLQSGQLPAAGVLPQAVRHWTLTTLREKLIKIGRRSCAIPGRSSIRWRRLRCRESLFQTIFGTDWTAEICNCDVRMSKSERNHMKTTATTEAVSSSPGENGHWNTKWRRPPRAGKKQVAD